MTTMEDEDLSQWLLTRCEERHTVVFVYANHRSKVFNANISNAPLLPADPDKESVKALKKLVRAGLLKRIELSLDEFTSTTTASITWTPLEANALDITEWVKRRTNLLGQGRGKAISDSTTRLVWHEAAGRCMYRGCGEDLGRTALTKKTARIGYLAHIVASDPDGPRGDLTISHTLSDEPENIMLMCDAHHRLIDRVDEDGHSTELLNEMRNEHINRVKKALEGLSYQRTKIIKLFGNVGNITTSMSNTDLCNAVLDRGFGPLPDIFNGIRRTQRDDRLPSDFGNRLLHEHKLEIENFISNFASNLSENGLLEPDALAVFPLHIVPILILAGRIIGEARRIELFQYHRNRQTWEWNLAVTPQSENFFYIQEFSKLPANEVLLSIELTASIDKRILPPSIAQDVLNGSIPWVRIAAMQPDTNCIRRQEDLDQFTAVARNAIRIVQDELRPSKVHLIGVSPASTLFRFGQMLQAGHHPAYIVYDRPDHTQPFKPVFSIEGQQVTSAEPIANNNQKITIQLR